MLSTCPVLIKCFKARQFLNNQADVSTLPIVKRRTIKSEMEILQVIIALAILGMSNGAHPHHKAPLMGLSSEDRIPQEYIVLLKADISPLSTRLDAFQGYITRRRLLGVEVMGQVQMREFVAILVSADDAAIEMLRSYQDVSMITTNTVIKINSQSTWTSEVDSGKCVQQEPGE